MIKVNDPNRRLPWGLGLLCIIVAASFSIAVCTATPRAVLVKADGGTAFDGECSTGYIVSQNVGRIRNTGDTPLAITGLEIIGRDALAFNFRDFNVHDRAQTFQPQYVPANSTYDYEFGLNVRCSAYGRSGDLRAILVVKTDDPRRPKFYIPTSATANRRPNLAIADVRGRVIKRHGKTSLRITFHLGNLSVAPTRRVPQVGVTLFDRVRVLRATKKLSGGETQRLGITIRNLPSNVKKFYLGNGTGDFSNPTLAVGVVRVDPLNRIHEGNENADGDLYDLEYSDYEYQYFVLAGR